MPKMQKHWLNLNIMEANFERKIRKHWVNLKMIEMQILRGKFKILYSTCESFTVTAQFTRKIYINYST